MRTDSDPCDLDLDVLMKLQALGVCPLLTPVELGQGCKGEEVHARPLFGCMSGFVRVTAAFCDSSQKMPPVVKHMIPK